jgi:hypothetical protein
MVNAENSLILLGAENPNLVQVKSWPVIIVDGQVDGATLDVTTGDFDTFDVFVESTGTAVGTAPRSDAVGGILLVTSTDQAVLGLWQVTAKPDATPVPFVRLSTQPPTGALVSAANSQRLFQVLAYPGQPPHAYRLIGA